MIGNILVTNEGKAKQIIEENPQVAIVIFNSQAKEGEGDGIYIAAKVEELSDDEEIKEAISIMNRRVTKQEFRVKRPEEIMGEGVWRIYKWSVC